MSDRRSLTFAATIGLSAMVLFLGLLPRTPRALRAVPDWAGHTAAYGAISFLAARSASLLSLTPVAPWAIGYAIGHGTLLELLQMKVPTRSAEWRDLGADGAGAALGAFLAWATRRRR